MKKKKNLQQSFTNVQYIKTKCKLSTSDEEPASTCPGDFVILWASFTEINIRCCGLDDNNWHWLIAKSAIQYMKFDINPLSIFVDINEIMTKNYYSV